MARIQAPPKAHTVAKHEAAHVIALDVMGGHFYEVVLRRHGWDEDYCGEVIEPTGPPETLLVTAVAGAVADVWPIGCDDWKVALSHLSTAKCCSADFAEAKRLAGLLDAGRSVAHEAISTAMHALNDFTTLWKATTCALLWLERELPDDGEDDQVSLRWFTDTYTPIPNCPPEWSDWLSIKKWSKEQPAEAVGAR